MTKWHRTCDHAARSIEADGVLRPHHHPIVGVALVWLSDRPDRSRASLGLTSRTLTCDRMRNLFRVDADEAVVPWLRWAADHGVRPGILSSGDPRSWWVSEQPVAAVPVR